MATRRDKNRTNAGRRRTLQIGKCLGSIPKINVPLHQPEKLVLAYLKTLKAEGSSLKVGRLNLSKGDRRKSARMYPHKSIGRGTSSGKFVSAFHIGTSGASSLGAVSII